MNENKICFITCVNDDVVYSECLKYINNLNIPENFEIETLCIKEAKSITSGYNEAMRNSDAKYKVYLHQDVFIINKNFIYDVIATFNDNNEIGILGLAGANTIPTNASWWDSTHRFGKVYENHTGKMKLLDLGEVEVNYQEVKALDGFLLATQYDVPWREDIFTGWHFYDISQCVEFTLKGYKAVVVRQEEPWCIHDCGYVETTGNYDVYREVFLDEYSKKIFPLVSILIPAYNKPEYLEIGLISVLNQTYRNLEIIICDDSTNDEVENMVKKYLSKHPIIKYRRNLKEKQDIFFKEDNDELRNSEGNNNAIKNFNRCLKLSSGEYVNFLMDDDFYREDKINTMMNHYIENAEVSLVTSYRQLINEKGNKLKDILATEKISENTVIIEGKVLRSFILESMMNSIGEPTSVLFKKKDLDGKLFGEFDGRLYYCNVDIATWIGLLSKGKAVYIPEALSSMRFHDDMRSEKISVKILGAIEWYNMLTSSFKLGYLDKILVRSMMLLWLKKDSYVLDMISEEDNFNEFSLEELYYCFDNSFKQVLDIN